MQKSASAPSSLLPSANASANNSISLANVERHLLPIGVKPLVASRMRLDATLSPAMLDLRMNTRNLVNEMQYNGGKIVSHQFSLMRPRPNNKFVRPKDNRETEKAIRRLQKKVSKQSLAKKQTQQSLELAASLNVIDKKSAIAKSLNLQDGTPKKRKDTEDEDNFIPISLDDQSLDEEVSSLLQDARVLQIWQTMQSKAEDDEVVVPGLPRIRVRRALEALGHDTDDKETVEGALKSLPGDGPLAHDEFCSIVAVFHQMRRKQLREHFRRLDEDSSGTIGVREFRHLLWDLGFTVTHETVLEYLNEADDDHSGEVEFAEFEHACHMVHQRHGFSKHDVHEFESLFDRYDTDGSNEMEADELASALGWFGSPCTLEQANQIIEKFDEEGTGVLAKPEFLTVMRQRLEDEISEVRSLFHEFDTDGSGTMDVEELLYLFQKCGYTITADVIEDAIKTALPKSGSELMFEDVLKVFYLVRKREGFSTTELDELKDIFDRHDRGGKAELREFELARCFNWLGYPLSQKRRRELWVRVDVDKTESIEYAEFLKLVRIIREEETEACRDVLHNCVHLKGSSKSQLPEATFNNLLKSLGYFPPPDIVHQAMNQCCDSSGDGSVDLPGLQRLLQFIREKLVARLRLCAGISDQQYQKIRGKFGLRMDAGKVIQLHEFEKVAYDLFPRARHDTVRQEMLKKIFKDQTGRDGVIKELSEAYWIVRQYADARDEVKWNLEQQAAAEAGFNAWQVASFREAYLAADENGDGSLSQAEIQSVFEDLMKLSVKQIQSMTKEFHNMGDKSDCIEFADFLRLMKIILGAGH